MWHNENNVNIFIKDMFAHFIKFLTFFRCRGPIDSVLLVLLHNKCSIHKINSLLINWALIIICKTR